VAAAITKRQKRIQKRGRPRLPAIEREPNGRQSRRKESQNVQAQAELSETPAIQRRIREDNIVPLRQKDGKIVSAEQQALDPRRGYALGLLLIDKSITQAQHDTGVRFGEDMARFYALTGVPFPSARAQNLFAVRGTGADESESRTEAAKRARQTAKRLEAVLMGVGDIDTGRKVAHTVKTVCVLDEQNARCWPEHMLNFLRRGLNALARQHYGME
jgi:hypothetical protein